MSFIRSMPKYDNVAKSDGSILKITRRPNLNHCTSH